MPVWPKSFYWFRLSLATAATEWALRRRGGAAAAQQRILRRLLRSLAATKMWPQAGVRADLSYAEFQKSVPLAPRENLAPAVERMKEGEPDVLWPGRCALFAASSGTTTGAPNFTPLTEPMLGHFRHAWADALLYYTVRVRHAGVFHGRHLFDGGSSALTPLGSAAAPGYVAGLSGLLELIQPAWSERHYYEPGAAIAQMPEGEAKRDAIAARTLTRDISLLTGLPNWTLELAEAVRATAGASGRPGADLQTLWPNLECFLHRGIPIGPYHQALRAVLGLTVKFHEVYLAPEGLFAVQDGEPVGGLRVLADAGLFFEFLPLVDYDATRIPQLGAKAVPLAEVKLDTSYALIVTTPGGLGRTLVGDIVRFTCTAPPRVVYAGRLAQRLEAFGESVIEKEVTDALAAVCGRRDWSVVSFHVAPLFAANLTGQNRGRHEWWIELRPGTVATPTGPQMASELDAELSRLNPDYAARRRAGTIEPPFVRLVMPGVFQHWLTFCKRWGGEHKLARCLSDRRVADQLAQLTNFARD